MVVVIFDEFPTDDLLLPERARSTPSASRTSRASPRCPRGSPTPHGLRLDLQGGARDPRRQAAQARDRAGRAQPQAERLPPVGPARLPGRSRSSRPRPSARRASAPARARDARACWRASRARVARRAWKAGSPPSAGAQQPGFYLHHALLPHEPWIYLPSGRRSRPTGEDPVPGINKPPSFDDRGLSQHNHLRHLLQVGYVDRQIGRLLRRLRRTRQLERRAVVVVADHGYSFDLNVPSRRLVTEDSVDEVAPVPFFVKRRARRGEGEVDESFVRNIDVVPTIADVLDTERGLAHTTATRPSRRQRARASRWRCVTRDFSHVVRIGRDELDRRRLANRRRWARPVRHRRAEPAPVRSTRGRRPTGSGRIPSCSTGAWPACAGCRPRASGRDIRNGDLVRAVSSGSGLLPTRVTGRLSGVARGESATSPWR